MTKKSTRPQVTAITEERAAMHLRLEDFAKKYSLSPQSLSHIFKAGPQTVGHWLAGRVNPPGPAVALLDVMEKSHEARELAGVYRWRVKVKSRKPKKKKEKTPPERVLVDSNPPEFDYEAFCAGPIPKSTSNT